VGNDKTYLMAPQEVVDEVVAHYKSSEALLRIADLEEYRTALPRYYSGKMLKEQTEQAPSFLKYEIRMEGMDRSYEVKDFAADGMECTIGVRQSGGKVHLKDRTTGETVEAFSNTLTIVRMRYDLDDRRWKGAELIEIVELDQ